MTKPSKPVVRKIPWEFDESLPFKWQPANPEFGVFCNTFTFIAVPFERYIVSVVRRAADRFEQDPDVAAEADIFLRQEAQHASAHRKHMLALVARYPELERCYEDACAAYDKLLEDKPIEFHAAYIANLEATFTPLFKVILDNRDSLFTGGDPRVGALMMWHFVEEIEHRSSGLILCRHINPNPWYRLKHVKATSAHVGSITKSIARTFDDVVPLEDRGTEAKDLISSGFLTRELKGRLPGRRPQDGPPSGACDGPPSMFHAVPTMQLVKMLWRLALSQTPHHDPADQPLPDWADAWMAEYARGTDMTSFVGAGATPES